MAVYSTLPLDNLKAEDIRDTLNANGSSVSNDLTTFFDPQYAKINKHSTCKPIDTGQTPHVKNMLYKGLQVVSPLTGHTVTVPYCFGAPNTMKGSASSPVGCFDINGCELITVAHAINNVDAIVYEYDSYNSHFPYKGSGSPFHLGDFGYYVARKLDEYAVKQEVVSFDIKDKEYNGKVAAGIGLHDPSALDGYYGTFALGNLAAYADTSYTFAMVVKDVTTNNAWIVSSEPEYDNIMYNTWGYIESYNNIVDGRYYDIYPIIYSAVHDIAVLLPQCDLNEDGDYTYKFFPVRQQSFASADPSKYPFSSMQIHGYSNVLIEPSEMSPYIYTSYDTCVDSYGTIFIVAALQGGKTYDFSKLQMRWKYCGGENANGRVEFGVDIIEKDADGNESWYNYGWSSSGFDGPLEVPEGQVMRVCFSIQDAFTDMNTGNVYEPNEDEQSTWEFVEANLMLDYVENGKIEYTWTDKAYLNFTYPFGKYSERPVEPVFYDRYEDGYYGYI
jgi:hypothetical protein